MPLVTSASREDIDGVVKLFDEIDDFYGDPREKDRERRTKQVHETLFGEPPLAYALLAHEEGRVVGLAAYSFLWPAAGTSMSLYLKELFVSQSYRRRGIGRLLMRELAAVALARACSRLELTTDRTNADALGFYRDLGVPVQVDKVHFRLEGDRLTGWPR